MSENEDTDKSQKTEEPTARRLEEARKRGQVIFSREVTNWVMLFCATLLVVGAAPGIFTEMRVMLQTFLSQAHALPADGGGLRALLADLFIRLGGLLALPFGVLIAAGILSGIIQTGPLLTFEPIKPDISKLSVIKGFGRLFSARSVMELIKGIVKLMIVSLAGILVLMPYFDGVEHFVGADFAQALDDMMHLFIKMMTAVLVVLFVLAVMDYLYQRHDFMQKMRMSKQEVKEEYKQTEGDPHVKAKLRQLREQKARQRMMQSVPEADVVITNPTHYAVALKYDPKKMDAPVMVAKGADLIAQKIKEIAKENKVPVIENAPLARSLHDGMDIDQMIPAEHFKAVAEVISYVFKLKGKKL